MWDVRGMWVMMSGHVSSLWSRRGRGGQRKGQVMVVWEMA